MALRHRRRAIVNRAGGLDRKASIPIALHVADFRQRC